MASTSDNPSGQNNEFTSGQSTTGQSTTERARERVSDAASALSDRARETYESGRDAAQRALGKSADVLDGNPLAIVAGGVALGAVLGAVLPLSEQERRTLGGTGRRVNQRAREAVDSAKEVGRNKLSELNLDSDGLRDQAKGLFSKLGEAAKAAASAATEQARQSGDSGQGQSGSGSSSGSSSSGGSGGGGSAGGQGSSGSGIPGR